MFDSKKLNDCYTLASMGIDLEKIYEAGIKAVETFVNSREFQLAVKNYIFLKEIENKNTVNTAE